MRSYRELWLWLGGLLLTVFAFLTAIAIAYFVKEPHYSLLGNWWMLGACVSFLAAFTCFFGAVRVWPFPPLAKPEFPDIKLEIYGSSAMDTERETGTGLVGPAHLRSFNVRFTNTEAEQKASLTVLLYVTLVPGSWGRVGEAICPPPDWALPPSLHLSPISEPFTLSPGETISGQLVYEIPEYYVDKLAAPMKARLELWDHVTDRRMSIRAAVGNHDKSAMVPSSGGAEILGLEYEGQADLQDGAEQATP